MVPPVAALLEPALTVTVPDAAPDAVPDDTVTGPDAPPEASPDTMETEPVVVSASVLIVVPPAVLPVTSTDPSLVIERRVVPTESIIETAPFALVPAPAISLTEPPVLEPPLAAPPVKITSPAVFEDAVFVAPAVTLTDAPFPELDDPALTTTALAAPPVASAVFAVNVPVLVKVVVDEDVYAMVVADVMDMAAPEDSVIAPAAFISTVAVVVDVSASIVKLPSAATIIRGVPPPSLIDVVPEVVPLPACNVTPPPLAPPFPPTTDTDPPVVPVT